MKKTLVKLCWPILKIFESNEAAPLYKKSHRVALNILGSVFIILSFGSAWATAASGGLGGLIPVAIFFCLGFVAVVVGTLGSNSAVCKIWGTR